MIPMRILRGSESACRASSAACRVSKKASGRTAKKHFLEPAPLSPCQWNPEYHSILNQSRSGACLRTYVTRQSNTECTPKQPVTKQPFCRDQKASFGLTRTRIPFLPKWKHLCSRLRSAPRRRRPDQNPRTAHMPSWQYNDCRSPQAHAKERVNV